MRIIRILIGWLVACFGAALTYAILGHSPGTLDAALDQAPTILDKGFADSMSLTAAIAFFSAIPALLGVQYAEQYSIRSWMYYAILSLVFAVAAYWLAIGAETVPSKTEGSLYGTVTLALMGLVFGTIYWLLAGRYAGLDAGAAKPVTAVDQKAAGKPKTEPRPGAKPDLKTDPKPGMGKPDNKKAAQA
jgi:hypothetical protein